MIDLLHYITVCAPNVAPSTMLAIVKTESRGNSLAIGLNHGKHLRYGARNLAEARSWVEYLEQHSYDFDIGLAQVNIRNVHKYGYRAYDMLDPCKNLNLAASILQHNYLTAKAVSENSREALYKALSAYNSGNYHTGFNNGYVQRVVNNARLSYEN